MSLTKKAQLVPHLSSQKLKDNYLSTTDRVESRRWHLVWLISEKWTIKEAAIAVGMNYDYAKDIVKAYNQQGHLGIKNGYKRNKERPSHALLNSQQLERLRESLKSPPLDKGLWSGPKVAKWIEKETGNSKVWAQRGWDYLKTCRYSLQTPRPRHKKGDKEEQEAFKKNSQRESKNFKNS